MIAKANFKDVLKILGFTELPELIIDSVGRPIGFEPATPRELTRAFEPLSAEIYRRED